MSTESLGSYSEFDDPHGRAMLPPQGPARPRRRHPPGAEHVKHRRTRSGCYTCRQRRVKVCAVFSYGLIWTNVLRYSVMRLDLYVTVCAPLPPVGCRCS